MFIKLTEASRTYDGVHPIKALRQVTLSIEKGEWITIMGPSGSGKTTLLNVIGGMDRLDEGEIRIDGQALSDFSYHELQTFRREKAGFVFQDYQLFDQYTVLENVMIPQWPYQPLLEIEQIAKEKLEQLNMSERVDHLPGELSGGEKQRTSLARALINDPDILLCDEPTGNLDSENSENIMQMLEKLHTEGMTIVLVTHDPKIAEYGDRNLYLRDGFILEDTVEA